MDASRSTRLIAVGAAALVVGTALTALAVRGADDAAAAPAQPEPAVAAVETAPPVEPAPRIPESIEVPEGHEAIALQLPFDAGVAGLPAVGDRVNVYGVFSAREAEGADATRTGPRVEAVLSGVEVLAITGPEVEAAGGTPTIVVALAPEDTPKVVFLQAFERTWLTLTPPDGTDPATSAVDHGSVTR